MSNFKTPEEFIEYYSEQLQDYMGTYNIQINKTGFIGFLLSILGWTNYDIKQYYDKLFKEMFVATASEDSSLLLHSSLYGYIPLFATPALSEGKIVLDWSSLPSNELDNQLDFNYQSFGDSTITGAGYLTFYIEDIPFTSYTHYIVKRVGAGSTEQRIVEIHNEDGSTSIVALSGTSLTAEIPLINFRQYYVKDSEYILDNYPLYSYKSLTLEIEEGEYISDIIVNVKEKESTSFEEFEVKSVKYFSESNDKHVFLRQVTPTKYILECGNGIHGKWIPNSTIVVILKLTKGASSNNIIRSETKNLVPSQLTYTYASGSSIVNIEFSDVAKIEVDNVSNGIDPLSGDDLRYAIVKYIQSRDVLISESDFYNVSSKYFNDFKFLFKKSKLQEHTFYLLRSFRDKYQNIVKTGQTSQAKASFGNEQYEPQFTINGNNYISPFLYKYNDELNLYESYIIYDNHTQYFSTQTTHQTSNDNPSTAYLNIKYDYPTNTTTIYFKSYQDITSNSQSAKITSDKLNYSSTPLTADVSNNYFYISFNGFTDEEFSVLIDYYDSSNTKLMTFSTDNIKYVYKMENIVDLQVYDNDVVNIPILDKDIYSSDPPDSEIYYKNKVVDFIIGNKLTENRAVCDNIQFRFLNTISIDNPYLQYLTKQSTTIRSLFPTIKDIVYEPPSSPNEGDLYFILPDAIGTFYGHDGDIAEYVNGKYIFHKITSTTYEKVIEIRNDPPVSNSTGDRYIVGTTPTGAWVGHNNEITEWNGSDWDYTIPEYPSICYVDNDSLFYRYYSTWDGSSYNTGWSSYISLKFPLKFYCYVVYNSPQVKSQNISITNDIDNLELEIAELLHTKYSGSNISYYNSQIIDYIHKTRPYVKEVVINIFDNDNILIPFGIESVDFDSDLFSNFSKRQIVDFTPPYWHWDIDNLEFRYKI